MEIGDVESLFVYVLERLIYAIELQLHSIITKQRSKNNNHNSLILQRLEPGNLDTSIDYPLLLKRVNKCLHSMKTANSSHDDIEFAEGCLIFSAVYYLLNDICMYLTKVHA